MYKNPLNNGDISDYNSLKKQADNGSKIKKYQSKKLETKPTELQKYYQYQTYQQPILDELNYVAERMRTEDIKKKTEDFNFIEDLKIKREGLMKETSKKEKDVGMETLFNKSSLVKQDDMTPVINTDIELETEPIAEAKIISNTPKIQTFMNDLFGEGDSIIEDLFSIADTAPIKEDKFELSRESRKKEKTLEQLAEIEAKKAKAQAKKEAKKAETQAKKEAKKEAKKAEKEYKKNLSYNRV